MRHETPGWWLHLFDFDVLKSYTIDNRMRLLIYADSSHVHVHVVVVHVCMSHATQRSEQQGPSFLTPRPGSHRWRLPLSLNHLRLSLSRRLLSCHALSAFLNAW